MADAIRPSEQWLRPLASQGGSGGSATLAPSPNFIGLVTNIAADPKGFIGLVTIGGGNVGNSGNVTLNVSPNFIGLVTSVPTANFASAATTYAVGTGSLWIDINGNLKATLGTLIAGEDLTNNVIKVEERFSFQALTSLVTVTAKSGAGFLHTLTIGNISGPTIELYDSLTATGTLIGRINAGSPFNTYTFDVTFATGLTLNPQPGTTILPNAVVSYR